MADLLPLVSYLLLKGRCRYCGKRIPVVYPLSETVTALVFVLTCWRFGMGMDCLVRLLLFAVLLLISFIDIREMIIPDMLLAFMLVLRLTAFAGRDMVCSIEDSFLAVFPVLIALLVMNVVKRKEMMGLGDIKLFMVLGLFADRISNICCIFFSALFALLFYAATGIRKELPFAPFICLSYFLMFIFGGN